MTEAISSPPLPARPQLQHNLSSQKSDLSTKSLPDLPSSKIRFEPNDNVSFISAVRQMELYEAPFMNETNDYLVVENNHTQPTLTTENEFWNKLIFDYSNEIIRKREVDLLENEILKGIPPTIRSTIYIKTLQTNYKFTNTHTFEDLKRKASRYNGEVSKLVKSGNSKDILSIFYSMFPEDGLKNASKFLGGVTDLIIDIPDLSDEDKIFILFKIYKVYVNEKQEDFVYKINRSFEDHLGCFKHIASQGINWSNYYKSILPKFFELDVETSLLILDLFIFEGFDFLLRLILWIFTQNEDNLAELNGEELSNYITSIEFLTENELNFKEILELNPSIIKYENELYLIKSNSMNNNSNELKNLIEINDDLQIKINELNSKINNLQITHTEISEQSEEYHTNLTKAETKRQDLITKRDQLKEKYEHLTMKENLLNTIKANKEFSERNEELQQQLTNLQKSVSDKKQKLVAT
ncbi:hypothetical protein KGF54_002494 [Candida jiufengensis]|uniref:uncharacterized protein n=1 Tax=Candida jiufengensis TaxID=497108 RepID=UPI00222558E4|nr:uncharacterized protein KGF54_002494 [Candida jiufengensis]KAI5953123.1 hypothetical protein KGF54_002494 [Candida jiufengensis]